MAANLPAIDENRGLPIHRAKAQNHTFLGPALGHRESAPVPEAILVADRLHHTRESRLNRKWHEDFSIKSRGRLLILWSDCVVPKPVQIQPILADHLRARIVGVRTLRGNVLGPARQQRSLGRLPFVRSSRTSSAPDEQ